MLRQTREPSIVTLVSTQCYAVLLVRICQIDTTMGAAAEDTENGPVGLSSPATVQGEQDYEFSRILKLRNISDQWYGSWE